MTISLQDSQPAIRELADALSAGNTRGADMMIWSAATTLSASDVRFFVSGCRSVGLDDAADQVLTSAGRRDAEAVLNIVAAFHKESQYEDAGLLLTAASRPPIPPVTRNA